MSSPTFPIVFGGLIAWSIYRRIRRNIGEQKLRPVRIVISLVVMSLFTTLFLVVSLSQLPVLAAMAGGLAAGAGLGFLGLRFTRFRTLGRDHFYTPNAYIGSALSLLFTGRMLYRMWQLRSTGMTTDQPQLFLTPFTLFLFGLIAGYYIVYYIGLFVHTHDQN